MGEIKYRYGFVIAVLLIGPIFGIAWYGLLWGLALLEASSGMRVFVSTYAVYSAVVVGFLAMVLVLRFAPAAETRFDRPLMTAQDRERVESLHREWFLLSAALILLATVITASATQVVAVGDGRLEISRVALEDGLRVRRSAYDISQVHLWATNRGDRTERVIAVPGFLIKGVFNAEEFEEALVAEGAGSSAPAGGREAEAP